MEYFLKNEMVEKAKSINLDNYRSTFKKDIQNILNLDHINHYSLGGHNSQFQWRMNSEMTYE